MNASKKRSCLVVCHGPPVLVALLACLLVASPAMGVTMVDRNSTVVVDPDSANGINSWTVDGIDHMFQQWFWYRIGPDGPESSIDTLGAVAVGSADIDGHPGDELLSLTYTGAGETAGITLNVLLTLSGGLPGSGASDLAEIITIDNTSGGSVNFHLFQYADFDLGGYEYPDDDTVRLVNANTVLQTDGGGGLTVSETIASTPSRYEVGLFSTTLDKLTDGVATTLSNDPGPYTGDATWAFQWDFTIGNNGSVQISKDKNLQLIPEPVTLAGLFLGIGSLVGYIRRRPLA